MVPIPRGKQRTVLAALLLSAGRVVSLDELAEALWGARPPSSARVAIQNHVMRLRRSLADAGSRIRTQPPGYLIQADASELDVIRFQAHVGTAQAAARASSWDTAAAEAHAAMALWRGEPLADVGSEALVLREGPRLTEMRLQALEARIDADIHLGRHAEAIIELRRLAAAHPLRERLHGLLMLALHRDGQEAGALAAYQHARTVLVEELGTEPGAGLRQMHQRILTADPAPTAPGPALAVVTVPWPAVPRELPGTVRHFTGRDSELTTLTRLISQAGDKPPSAVVISVIGGTAGVGKTALAVHWAHQVAGRFPDGQLYVDLRGYDPGQPVPTADALAGFLHALGVPGHDIPAREDERAARYRSTLAGRQMLVVLDNARSVQQVRPLLPGTPTCVTVVTSRDPLAGLVARDGAVRLDLDVLPSAEAIGLLRALIGNRVDAEPDAAAELAAQCCQLPLALRIAAELAAAHPGASLAGLTGEFADQQQRLDLLDVGADPHSAVRTVFSWSYQNLDPVTARAFRLLSLHPGPDLDSYAAAALTSTTLGQVIHILDGLTRAHLIQAARPGRYAMHDLLRAYARELAASKDDDDERRARLTCLFGHYLDAAAAATDVLSPAGRHLRPRVSTATSPIPPFADLAEARAWLDAERANLVAVAAHASVHGWPGQAIRLSGILSRYMDDAGHYPEEVLIHGHALQAARHSGDVAAEADALRSLAAADIRHGRYPQASAYLDRALALFRETGNQDGEARTLNGLGLIHLAMARYPRAALCLQQSLDLFRKTGDRHGQGRALSNLGVALLRQGYLQEAAHRYQQALALCREIGDRSALAETLLRLGVLNLQQNRRERAVGQFRQALVIFRQIGEPPGEAGALARLGDTDLSKGRYQQAVDQIRQALTLFRQIGDKRGEVWALNGLGEASLAMRQPADARAWHVTALGIATQIGVKDQQARAHNGLARGYHATGDLDRALRHWQEALAIYSDIGAPEAGQVRAQLAAVGT